MKKFLPLIIILILVLGGFVYFQVQNRNNQANNQDLTALAQCLSDGGVKFYGAFWCSHCQNQKKMFGAAADYLPYVECSTPDQKGQTPACIMARINAYPTWVFGDGSRISSELSPSELSQKSGCALNN